MGKLLKLAFKLEETDSPIWSNDKVSKAKFGNNITDFSKLKMNPKIILQVSSLVSLYKERINPINPDLPSLWSGKMHSFYQKFTIHVFSELESRFRKFYALENKEIEFMNQKVHINDIDKNLMQFISNPAKYADDNGIVYSDAEELNKKILKAYETWQEKEASWI